MKPSSAFVGCAVGRRELLRKREERAVGEVVAVDEEEVALARGRVVELQLGSRQRLRHTGNGIVVARCPASRFIHFPSFAARPRRCSPSDTPASGRPSRSCPRSTTSRPTYPPTAMSRRGAASRSRISPARSTATWRAGCFAGHAAREPEALRDLFEAQAGELGVSRFMLTVPGLRAGAVDAWFRLAFGCQAVWAVREVEPAEPGRLRRTIRPATPDDVDAMIDARQAPLHAPGCHPELLRLVTADARESAPRSSTSLGGSTPTCRSSPRRDGGVVGPSGSTGVRGRPPRAARANIDLAFAATRDEVRGTGAALALTAFAFDWAHEHGFRSMTVDWRSVNLLSSRFWPRRGFRPQYLRLYRVGALMPLSVTPFALFCLASAALAVVPGPAVTYIVTHSVDKGRRAGLASAARSRERRARPRRGGDGRACRRSSPRLRPRSPS